MTELGNLRRSARSIFNNEYYECLANYLSDLETQVIRLLLNAKKDKDMPNIPYSTLSLILKGIRRKLERIRND